MSAALADPSASIVVMGVSGCGKSTVGGLVARDLDAAFIDADDLHSAAAVAKMAAGTPLDDDDRRPWLDRVAEAARGGAGEGERVVIACSALRRVYRDRLRAGAGRPLVFVHLVGSRELLVERLASRTGHFMPTSLLDSQLATVEPLEVDEVGITVDIAPPTGVLVDGILDRLAAGAP